MGCIIELLRRSCEQAPDASGNRNTRWAIIRNTLQQLRTTVLADIQQYLSPITRYFVTDSTVQVRIPLPDGTTVVSDWLLIPLDSPDDQKRLLSMQLTGAWINELREVPIEIVSALLGRLGRYPSKLNGGPTWFGLIADSNPWDTDSPYHERLVLDPLPNWALYHQPSGVGPLAENTENLPPGYYENLNSGRDEGWSEVHIESQWGTSNAGQAVFRRSFHAPTHVMDLQAIINPLRPLLVGMDFGRTPTALLGQVDTAGVLNVYREVSTEDMGLIQMVQEQLLPVLQGEPYGRARVAVVGDPAGVQRSSLTEETSFDTLKSLGLLACPASTNAIRPRLTAVERRFRGTIAGGPAIRISRAGCPLLIRALGNMYRYRKKRDGQLEDIPEKLHPWSDLCFVAGTQIATPAGQRAIETLRHGDFVLTHLGPRRVVATGARNAPDTSLVALDHGGVLRCTPDHPFMVDRQPVQALHLTKGTILEGVKCADMQGATGNASTATAITGPAQTRTSGARSRGPVAYGSLPTVPYHTAWSCITAMKIRAMTRWITSNCSRVKHTWSSSVLPRPSLRDVPGGANARHGAAARFLCMLQCGSTITELFRKVWRSTTKTMIRATAPSAISCCFLAQNTHGTTCACAQPRGPFAFPPKPVLRPQPGTPVRKATPGTCSTAPHPGPAGHVALSCAPTAAAHTTSTPRLENAGSAPPDARPQPVSPAASTTKPAPARYAPNPSSRTGIEPNPAAPRVAWVKQSAGPAEVFNLTVDDAHTYYAGGVLVHNCDTLQYLCLGAESNVVGRLIARQTTRVRDRLVPTAGWT